MQNLKRYISKCTFSHAQQIYYAFLVEIPVKEGRRSAPTVRLVRFYRCEAPPSIVKSLDACLYSVLLGLVNGLLKK
jgi:hypothetical protein